MNIEQIALEVWDALNGGYSSRNETRVVLEFAKAFHARVDAELDSMDLKDDSISLECQRILRERVDYWKHDSAAAWDKCEERRLENERLVAELAAIKQEKLASVDPLPGKEWSARAVCASAMADITDKTPIMILILDENQRTKHYSANLNNGIASWMLLYKINEILNP